MAFIAPTTAYIICFTLTTWAFIIFRFIRLFRRSQFRNLHNCQLPPKAQQKHLLFGFDIPFLLSSWLKKGVFLQESYRLSIESGRTFSLRILGKNTIWTTSPSNVQALLSSQFSDFKLSVVRTSAFKPYTGDGIFSSNGKTWSHARSILRPSLGRVQIANLEIYERHFREMAALIPRNGETVDLQKLFSRLTIDTASDFLFGESAHALDPHQSSTAKAVSEAFDYTSQGLAFRLQMGAIKFLLPDKKFKKSVSLIHEYVDYFVDKAVVYREADEKGIEGSTSKYVYLRELAKDTGDRRVLRDQIVSILAAGRDTTAALLTLSFWLLLRHPRVVEKLREEIAVLGGVPPTYEQLKGMKYLRWVLDETLRVYPPVPLNERCPKRDAVLPAGGGPNENSPIFVSKGQIIVLNVYALHRDVGLWGPDAAEFRPERWANLKPGWKYVPFGGGPRICLGQQLALTEAGYTMVRLMQTFGRMENRGEEQFRETVGVTLSVTGGVQAALFEI